VPAKASGLCGRIYIFRCCCRGTVTSNGSSLSCDAMQAGITASVGIAADISQAPEWRAIVRAARAAAAAATARRLRRQRGPGESDSATGFLTEPLTGEDVYPDLTLTEAMARENANATVHSLNSVAMLLPAGSTDSAGAAASSATGVRPSLLRHMPHIESDSGVFDLPAAGGSQGTPLAELVPFRKGAPAGSGREAQAPVQFDATGTETAVAGHRDGRGGASGAHQLLAASSTLAPSEDCLRTGPHS
jgi:hypothetical protein